MAEVGRAAVRDPGELLPGGFWEAVAVWLEKPQVANKRLCGVRLEARRRAALPRVSPRGRRPNAGPEQEEPGAAGRGPRPPEGGPGRGPEESRHRRQQGEGPGEAAAAPLPVEGPGQPDKAGAGEGDFSAWDLDSLWDDFSRSLAGGSHELLAFLTGARAGSQPEAPSELDVVLRTVIPKTSPRCPLAAPRREVVVQGRSVSGSEGCRRSRRTPVKAARRETDFNYKCIIAVGRGVGPELSSTCICAELTGV